MQTLHQLLEATLAPDTAVLKAVRQIQRPMHRSLHLPYEQATTQLNTQYFKKPECIPALFEISITSSNQGVSARALSTSEQIAKAKGRRDGHWQFGGEGAFTNEEDGSKAC